MIHATNTVFWTDVPSSSQCTANCDSDAKEMYVDECCRRKNK